MFFRWGKDFFKALFVNISSPVPSINNVQSLTVDNLMSENFEIKLGVKQGDPPSPFSFNMYMDELCCTLMIIQNSTDVPLLNDMKVPCLFWADDLVLISATEEGLEKQIDFADKYCYNWKLTLNVEKTKTVIFNKNGAALSKNQLKYRGKQIKTVKHFNCLGITLDSNGLRLNTAINELSKKS